MVELGNRLRVNAIYHGQAVAGRTYPYVQYGKPAKATYEFAERVLRDRLEELNGGRMVVGDMPRV